MLVTRLVKYPESFMKGTWVVTSLIVQLVASTVTLACDVTLPAHRPVVPDGAFGGGGSASGQWYGSRSLAALIPNNGQWRGRGGKRDYSGKLSWWYSGFDSSQNPHPDLVVSAKRLDGPAETVRVTRVRVGSKFSGNDELDSMQVSLSFPASGCWEVKGTYDGTETLKLVFWVGD